MIRYHLVRMMGECKMCIAAVARETGLSRVTITLLYKETAQEVDLDAIGKLRLLFECQVDGWDFKQFVLGTKKQSVFQKVAAFVEKFKGVGGKL